MSKFGWSYPAGCSGPPDQDDGVTDLEDAILGLLEDAGIDTETNDAVMKLVRAGENKKWEADNAATAEDGKCPRCHGEGFILLADGNPFAKTIFQMMHSMRRVACDCPAGARYRKVDAYNQAVADETARITR